MKRRNVLVSVSVVGALGMLVLGGAVWGNVKLRVPQEIVPPVYLGGGGPSVLSNGSIFFLNDGEWAAIPFWRPPESVPPGFDLLNDFDPGVFDTPLLVEGDVTLKDGALRSWNARGLGAVPVWFVRVDELEEALVDAELTIEELALCASLLIGTAGVYKEQNHVEGVHPASHLSVSASGALEGGGTFDLHFVEVGLELVRAQIDFEL